MKIRGYISSQRKQALKLVLIPGVSNVFLWRQENGHNFGRKVGDRCCMKIDKAVQTTEENFNNKG